MGPAAREEHVRGELERLFREWTVRAALFGALIFLLIAQLDFISAPALAPRFLAYRCAASAGLLLLWWVAGRASAPWVLRASLLAGVALSAVAVEVMILHHGGSRSAYVDGMILLGVTVLGFIPASVGFHAFLAALIYAVYLVPLLLWGGRAEPGSFFTQNYLFIAILAVTVFMRHLHRVSLRRELGLAFDLAAKERRLETQVEERTRELVRAAAQWRATFDSVSDAILMLDGDGRIVRANRAAAALVRRELPGLPGEPLAALLRSAGLAGSLAPLEALWRTGASASEEVAHAVTGGWFLVTAEPVHPDLEQVGGSVLTLRGITHIKDMEDERHRLSAQLLQAQKMESIGTLAAGIAHDFNNILLAVIGLTDAAAERIPPGHPARQELDDVIGAAERGSGLVQQLLAFGRQQELRMRRTDLRRLVEESRAMLAHLLPRTIALEVRAGEQHPVIADPVQIGQVLMNLAVNGRDAMPEGGRLTFEIGSAAVARDDPAHPGVPPGLYALLVVRDTGAGMSPEVRARIFEPFFTTKEAGHGTGLGLATVYGIVSQHGGTVRVESEPGAGASFFVYLPAAPGPVDLRQEAIPGGTESVLLVEDDPVTRQVIGRRLADLGYRVTEAAGGEEALRAIERRDAGPDLLLCDAALPGVGARGVAAAARSRWPRTRIVFVSEHPEWDVSRRGLLAPGDLLLSKGLGPDEIARRLRDELDRGVLE